MKREEQRKLRELKKALPKLLKEKAKKYKFKKKDFMLWFNLNDLFFTNHIDVRETIDGGCCCSYCIEVKPLWIDDLLWKCLDMEENIKEPISLRSTGAFTVSGVEVHSNFDRMKEWTVEELELLVDQYLDKFYEVIQKTTIEDFYSNLSNDPYHEELRIALTLVHGEKYQEALDYLSTKDKGRFCNGNLWVNDGIREYCRNRMD